MPYHLDVLFSVPDLNKVEHKDVLGSTTQVHVRRLLTADYDTRSLDGRRRKFPDPLQFHMDMAQRPSLPRQAVTVVSRNDDLGQDRKVILITHPSSQCDATYEAFIDRLQW